MNRKEFSSILRNELRDLPKNEIEEIVYDFEEHFTIGLESGKSEEEISKELGDPKKIAKSYKVSAFIKEAKNNPSTTNIVKAVLATMAIGFFNLVFILGPFVGLIGIIIGLFGASMGVFIGGIAMILGPIMNTFIEIVSIPSINPIACMFFGISMSCFGILFTILNVYISKLLYEGTVRYLKWNVDIIKK
ncbi:DUF1700 domain-containing protein [Lutibacter sp. B2]|nr:DUF1700 domain-containing protein [Lutibacter sp. B2]